jgi:hypothetical protein
MNRPLESKGRNISGEEISNRATPKFHTFVWFSSYIGGSTTLEALRVPDEDELLGKDDDDDGMGDSIQCHIRSGTSSLVTWLMFAGLCYPI